MVKIPTRLDELLPAAAMNKVLEVLQQPDLSSTIRDALKRVGVKDTSTLTNPLVQAQQAWQQAKSWIESVAQHAGMSPMKSGLAINATGQLFSAELTSVPMASSVAYNFARSASSSRVASHIEAKALETARRVIDQSGANFVWLDSLSSALLILRNAEQTQGGWVMSRSDAVRLVGVGEPRSILSALNAAIVDVGATNGASQVDWEEGLVTSRQAILLVSPNGLSASEANAQRVAACEAARSKGSTLVVELLADAVFSKTLRSEYHFPSIDESLRSGVDVVIVPVNALVAGPEGVLVIGKSSVIETLDRKSAGLNVRLRGPRLESAAEALQLASSEDIESGVASYFSTHPENLKNRAERLAIQLNGIGPIGKAEAIATRSPLGPSPWNRYELSNWGVKLTSKGELSLLAKCLNPPGDDRPTILVKSEANSITLDLRFVAPEDDHRLAMAFLPTSESAPDSSQNSEEDSDVGDNS